jgi:hypothetical protein
MPPIWQPRDNDTLKAWIDTILNEAEDRLSDWERKFIADMEPRIAAKRPLTQGQEEKLEQIYAEYTA